MEHINKVIERSYRIGLVLGDFGQEGMVQGHKACPELDKARNQGNSVIGS